MGGKCRRSLVYFAYPPPGISLDDVRRVVTPLVAPRLSSRPVIPHDGGDTTTSDDDPRPPPALSHGGGIYDRYSLLHDQSYRSGEVAPSSVTAAARVHARIRGMPFHRVIEEKWDQVQRGSETEEKRRREVGR
ncbi:hypothetical protein ACHAXA_000560 [Cyclostephanos tholiformis]|uniref:Uncharacterized protein n=1 Tax=Cyclostephanos tholiformis TaxID=382380 RepID=A0ABD3SSU0_9STRA